MLVQNQRIPTSYRRIGVGLLKQVGRIVWNLAIAAPGIICAVFAATSESWPERVTMLYFMVRFMLQERSSNNRP